MKLRKIIILAYALTLFFGFSFIEIGCNTDNTNNAGTQKENTNVKDEKDTEGSENNVSKEDNKSNDSGDKEMITPDKVN